MSSTKNSNSSKTAHVMNLLRKNQSAPADAPAEAPAPDHTAAADTPIAPPRVHPIITSLNEEASVSLEIKAALEDALEEIDDSPAAVPPEYDPQPPKASAPEPPPAPTTPPAPPAPVPAEVPVSPAPPPPPAPPVVQAAPVSQPVMEAAPPVSPVVQEVSVPQVGKETVVTAPAAPEVEDAKPAVSVSAEPEKEAAEKKPAEVTYVNVMQALVEEKADKYINLFGLCQCGRCRADVKALALNNLQPKYVVMLQGEYIPRITVYEQRFDSTVTAQLLRACKTVMEFPRHEVLG